MNLESSLPAGSSVREVRDLALSSYGARSMGSDGLPFMALPDGHILHSTEVTLPKPFRQRGTVSVVRLEDFVRLVQAATTPGDAVLQYEVFADKKAKSFIAVLNYDGWRDNRVSLRIEHSGHFTSLSEAMGRVRNQKELIRFLEDFSYMIMEPQAAAMLEVAQNFRATQNVRYTSVQELANGSCNFEYVKSNEAGTTDAKGKVKMPEEIVMGCPVFEGEEPSRLRLRIGYDIKDGALTFSLAFHLFHLVERDLSDRRMRILSELLNGKLINVGEAPEVKPITCINGH